MALLVNGSSTPRNREFNEPGSEMKSGLWEIAAGTGGSDLWDMAKAF